MFYSKPWLDALIILAVILLFFGPKRLPALGRSLGHGMREFKDAITGHSQPTESERAELESQTAPAAGTEHSPAAAGQATRLRETEPAAVTGTPPQGSSGSQSG
jgi:sec-independent protein translocase protein TatA